MECSAAGGGLNGQQVGGTELGGKRGRNGRGERAWGGNGGGWEETTAIRVPAGIWNVQNLVKGCDPGDGAQALAVRSSDWEEGWEGTGAYTAVFPLVSPQREHEIPDEKEKRPKPEGTAGSKGDNIWVRQGNLQGAKFRFLPGWTESLGSGDRVVVGEDPKGCFCFVSSCEGQ